MLGVTEDTVEAARGLELKWGLKICGLLMKLTDRSQGVQVSGFLRRALRLMKIPETPGKMIAKASQYYRDSVDSNRVCYD